MLLFCHLCLCQIDLSNVLHIVVYKTVFLPIRADNLNYEYLLSITIQHSNSVISDFRVLTYQEYTQTIALHKYIAN